MNGAGGAAARPLRKDQARALNAYAWAQRAKETSHLPDYEIAVQSFTAALLQSGLAVAVAVLERSQDREGFKQLLAHLAGHPAPGLSPSATAPWPDRVRKLDLPHYMQATRELIALLAWLRRACRALGE